MTYLLSIGIILLAAKMLAILSTKLHLPRVVGALLTGIILGPSFLGVLHENEIIRAIAEIGVVVLMFEAGLETDINRFEKNMKAYIIIASFGVLVPLIMGTGTAYLFSTNFTTNLFIGVILTATSVSITVEALHEMRKLNTDVGSTILGAALVDDIIGIVLLSIILGRVGSANQSVSETLFRISAFFGFAIVVGVIFHYFFSWLEEREGRKHRIPVIAIAFCFIFSYIAEKFGVADITGAYIAGLVFANTRQNDYIKKKVEIVSYMLVSPVFFASIGIGAVISGFNKELIFYTIIITLVAVISKIIGGIIGAGISGFKIKDAFKISIGMVARGEVALIIANKGKSLGIIDDKIFTAIVLMVIFTTLITPICLEIIYGIKKEKRIEA